MKDNGRFWICAVIAVCSMWLCSTVFAGWDGQPEATWDANEVENVGLSVGLMTNAGTSMLEGRVGFDVGQQWTVGILGQWLTEDEMGRDFAGGGYLIMDVTPEASIPVSDWFGGLIPGLPETLTGSTYAIGKLLMYDADGQMQMAGAIGTGVLVGPLMSLEAIYNVVEEGGTGNPTTESGLEVYAGVCIRF